MTFQTLETLFAARWDGHLPTLPHTLGFQKRVDRNHPPAAAATTCHVCAELVADCLSQRAPVVWEGQKVGRVRQ